MSLLTANREYSEAEIVKTIMRHFYEIAEKSESFKDHGSKQAFDFFISKTMYTCQTEIKVTYTLPNEFRPTHSADIVIAKSDDAVNWSQLNPSYRFVYIEVKHKSSVTDAFKARAYDMIHIKKEYPSCMGVIIYVRERSTRIEKAKEFCYPYNEFFGCKTEELTKERLDPLFQKIVAHLKEGRAQSG